MIISIIENDINDENVIMYKPRQEVLKSSQNSEIWSELKIKNEMVTIRNLVQLGKESQKKTPFLLSKLFPFPCTQFGKLFHLFRNEKMAFFLLCLKPSRNDNFDSKKCLQVIYDVISEVSDGGIGPPKLMIMLMYIDLGGK